ncbi:MAG: hypothetical protein EOM20_07405 [Spartobacteria bacterium]|nr:hypothetical protein [Spartobacteria bacterium]
MNEYETIKHMSELFSQSPDQLNTVFSCDAELIRIGEAIWGLTIDEFTPEEDLFTMDDPCQLGANLATATLSDLLASGIEPRFYMHTVSLPTDIDPAFVTEFSNGIHHILEKACCMLIGGDFSTAPTWRYCGFAMGPSETTQPLSRIMPASPQTLWVTGDLGDLNSSAFVGATTPCIELRTIEARLIHQHASACIDTSSGFMDAIWLLHHLNPTMKIEINTKALPLAPSVRETAQQTGVIPEAALVGGAGEYELLFTTPSELDEAMEEIFSQKKITRIGRATPAEQAELILKHSPGQRVNVNEPPPCARSMVTRERYIEQVIQQATKLFHP